MTFDPNAHPRDTSGQFAEKTGAAPEVDLAESLSRFSADDTVPLEDVDWDVPAYVPAANVDPNGAQDVVVQKVSDTAYDIIAYRPLPGDTSDEYEQFLDHEYNATFEKHPQTGGLYVAFASRYDTIDHPGDLTEADVRLLAAESAGVYDRDNSLPDGLHGAGVSKYWAWREKFYTEDED